jgi:hypothetical protein
MNLEQLEQKQAKLLKFFNYLIKENEKEIIYHESKNNIKSVMYLKMQRTELNENLETIIEVLNLLNNSIPVKKRKPNDDWQDFSV